LRAIGHAAVLGLIMSVSTLAAHSEPNVGEGTARAVSFIDVPGWAQDDTLAAWRVFHNNCTAMTAVNPKTLRAGLAPPPALITICTAAAQLALSTQAEARAFFEQHFQPYEITPPSGAGFLTGYYEPEVQGSLTKTPDFQAPLLSKPVDSEVIAPGETRTGIPEGFAAARRKPDGTLTPYPDRAAIQAGAMDGEVQPLLWLRDDAEVFFLQVQGSGRVRLPDGSVRRIAYAGRNGHPYTMIGRVLVQEGHLPLEQAQLEPIKAWLRANPAEGQRIMQLNRSYVFFRVADELPIDAGPIGGAGLPLTPWRSIAVDRTRWPYGLPIWIDAMLPGITQPFQKLTIAEDTGSAILGVARADLFHGSGAEAGVQAGALRHPMRFIVLWPKAVQ
jgi:membrane-bound lytic murein transglycosylase A